MKAQTHWLPHWKASQGKAVKCNGYGMQDLKIIPHCPRGSPALRTFCHCTVYRFSLLTIIAEQNPKSRSLLPALTIPAGPSHVPKWARFTTFVYIFLPFPPTHADSERSRFRFKFRQNSTMPVFGLDTHASFSADYRLIFKNQSQTSFRSLRAQRSSVVTILHSDHLSFHSSINILLSSWWKCRHPLHSSAWFWSQSQTLLTLGWLHRHGLSLVWD